MSASNYNRIYRATYNQALKDFAEAVQKDIQKSNCTNADDICKIVGKRAEQMSFPVEKENTENSGRYIDNIRKGY